MEWTYRNLADLLADLGQYAASLTDLSFGGEAAMINTAMGVASSHARDELRHQDNGDINRRFYASMAETYAPAAPKKVGALLYQLAQFLREGQMSTVLPQPLAGYPDSGEFVAAHVDNVRADRMHAYVVAHGPEVIELVDETGAALAEATWLSALTPRWELGDRFWRSRARLVQHLRRVEL